MSTSFSVFAEGLCVWWGTPSTDSRQVATLPLPSCLCRALRVGKVRVYGNLSSFWNTGHMSVHIPGTILEFLKLPWTSHSLAFWVGLTVSPTVIYCLKQAQCSAIACNCFQNSPLGKRLSCWVSSKSSQTKTTSWVSLPGNYQTSQTRPVLGKGVWRIFHILPAPVTARLLFTTMNMSYLF